jgi:hypothetical protein
LATLKATESVAGVVPLCRAKLIHPTSELNWKEMPGELVIVTFTGDGTTPILVLTEIVAGELVTTGSAA